MKAILSLALLLFVSVKIFAQIPEEALRLSWQSYYGTARNQAIGGAMGSLGGDATANVVNPAGLGFFKTSDFVLTPGWLSDKGKGNFRGTDAKGSSVNNFRLGTSGLIFGGMGYDGKSSFGITVTKTADFNQQVYYKGQNDYSSFTEPLADEFYAAGYTDPNMLLNDPNISLQTKMAVYTYLVDTATINGSINIIARPEFAGITGQEQLINTSGGITEVTFGFGREASKKWMAGMSLGIPILKMERNSVFTETDASGNADNDFGYLRYTENYRLTGVGLNLKGGVIFRPQDYLRVGLAFHSPSWILAKESFNSKMVGDVENLFGAGNGVDSVTSKVFTGNDRDVNQYIVNSPSRIILSGSYVFREVADIASQKGFITADIEYTNYKWMKFSPRDETVPTDVFTPYNNAIDEAYRGAFNFRLGGELKFKTVMVRAGFAYLGNPYKDKEIKANRMNLSGGLGYRNKGMFIDLTYVYRLQKDANFPYRVNAPRLNTFASVKNNGGNVLLTLGFKI